MAHESLTRYAWLSIAAAILTIALKSAAYVITGSVGLLSDALESLVNLVAAIMALAMLTIAARPPDADHTYGHEKAEYFSSGVEGALILVAALSIVAAALLRLFAPQPIEQAGLGLAISVVASLVNLGVALVLRRAGRRNRSITLEADSAHLMTDVWTSAGVLAAIGLVALTDWEILDPIIALVVAANIIWSGFGLMRRSALGLMDTALPHEQQVAVQAIQQRYMQGGLTFHALRSRQSGSRNFVWMHVMFPGTCTVQHCNEVLEQIEADIRQSIPHVTVFTHMEPLDDPVSWQDAQLDRLAAQPPVERH
jgi:cation diffusion facilitator family transporter